MLYLAQSLHGRLLADRMSTELKMALLYVPDHKDNVPLKQLIAEKQRRDAEAQASAALLSRDSNWDIRWEAGGHQRLSGTFQNPVEPYGVVSFSYNLSSRSNSRNHLEKAAAAYIDWKNAQQGDVVQNARILEQQINQIIVVQLRELKVLREREQEVDSNLRMLVGVDTAAAFSFSSQLEGDIAVLQVEINDLSFRLQALQDYLQNNF
jgi:hypothetical protein